MPFTSPFAPSGRLVTRTALRCAGPFTSVRPFPLPPSGSGCRPSGCGWEFASMKLPLSALTMTGHLLPPSPLKLPQVASHTPLDSDCDTLWLSPHLAGNFRKTRPQGAGRAWGRTQMKIPKQTSESRNSNRYLHSDVHSGIRRSQKWNPPKCPSTSE